MFAASLLSALIGVGLLWKPQAATDISRLGKQRRIERQPTSAGGRAGSVAVADQASPRASFSGASQGSYGFHWSRPSRKIGRRTCSELGVRTLRRVLWNSRQAGSKSRAAVVEEPPHAAVEVGDQVLVLHAQHRPGRASSQWRIRSR